MKITKSWEFEKVIKYAKPKLESFQILDVGPT